MYYIGNVRYFLTKTKLGQPAINKIIEQLEGQVVNNTTGDMGFVTAGSVREILDTDKSFAFSRDFQNDPMHLKIVATQGVIPVLKLMSPDEILDRLIELETENPSMFSHPKAKPNEVWLEDMLVDFVHVNVGEYQRHGMPSTRIDKSEPIMKPVKGIGDCAHYSVFVDAEELVKAEYAAKHMELV